MANIALKSGASGAANGANWTDAYTTVTAALAADVAGDRVLVSQAHSESTSGNITLSFAGTVAAPSMMICADDSAWVPTAEATGAVIATTSAGNITISGTVKIKGVEFRAATSTNAGNISYVQDLGYGHFVGCTFYLTNTATTSRVAAGNSTQKTRVRYEDCLFRFSHASQAINFSNADVEIIGGGLHPDTVAPTTSLLNVTTGYAGIFRMVGSDLRAGGAGMHLLATTGNTGRAVLSNLKLPASWTGELVSAAPSSFGFRAELYDCISGSDRILCRVQDYAGKVSDDQVRVRSGGSSVDSIDYSLKFATTANASAAIPLRGPAIPHTPVSGGSAVTATVKLMIDDATAWTEADAALVVMYRPTSGSPVMAMTSTEISVLETPATLPSNSDTWVETGVTNVQKRALSVTFTPQEDGYLVAWLEVFKPSATLYCDHTLTVA